MIFVTTIAYVNFVIACSQRLEQLSFFVFLFQHFLHRLYNTCVRILISLFLIE